MRLVNRIAVISFFLAVFGAGPAMGAGVVGPCASFAGASAPPEVLEECRERLKRAENIKLWDKMDRTLETESVGKILKKKFKELTLEDSDVKPYLGQFLIEVGKRVSTLEHKSNKRWIDEYLFRMQNYIDARSRHQTIVDEKSQLKTILGTLLKEKLRIHSLTQVYLQNMAGVPTTYLVVGRDKYKLERKESNMAMFRRIAQNAIPHVADYTSNTLIFSRTEIENARIVRDVITAKKGVRVEPYGKDPKIYSANKLRYLVQKFRCFPSYTEQPSESVNPERKRAENTTASYWIIEHPTISDALMDEMFPQGDVLPEHRRKLKLEIEKRYSELTVDDAESLEQVWRFVEKYEKWIGKIIRKQEDLNRQIWPLVNRISKRIITKSPGINVRKNLLEPTDEVINIGASNISHGKKRIDDMWRWLNKMSERFKDDEEIAQATVENWLKHRRIIISTTKSEIVVASMAPHEVAKNLFDQALKTLKERNRYLKKFEESIVREGSLSQYRSDQYYVVGNPVRCLLFPPVYALTSNAIGPEGNTYGVSFFLALEVEYSVKEGAPPDSKIASDSRERVGDPPGATAERKKVDKKIFKDEERGFTWYIVGGECFSKKEGKEKLPEGFKLPDLEQIGYLKSLVFSPSGRRISGFYPFFTKSDSVLWTRSLSPATDKTITYVLATGDKEFHGDSFCAIVVGVKPAP